MKDKGHSPRALDVAQFARDGGALQGRWPLAGMPRLAAAFIAASDGDAVWSAQGERVAVAGSEAEVWLSLGASADVPLQCQRCLQPMVEPLRVQRRFRFVRHEDEAARLDEESEDDVLVLSPRLDLHELLEDELILALPLVPRHENCPRPLPVTASADAAAQDEEEAVPHPFAALAALRGKPPRGGSA
jgi:uncharacterized protein